MKDYENIKVSVSFSAPIWLLKEFDKVALKKNMKRSGMFVELMKWVVNKEKG